MAIRWFEFDAGLSAAFADFREELYAGDGNWIPASRAEFLGQFSPEFPFYRHAGNRHRHFIASANGRTVGHISALVNSDLKDRDGTPVGCLGFFESVNDDAVAGELLEQASEWLVKENHLRRIWAPVDFDIWHGYRLMTRGFAEKTFFGEPYNKLYYPELLTGFGFAVKKTWDSLEVKGRAPLERMIARFETRYRAFRDARYRFEAIDVRETTNLQQLYKVLIRSYHGFLGATPFGFDDFERLLGQYLKAFDARFVNLVFDASGNVAAFSVAYPDYSDALRVAGREVNAVNQPGSRAAHRAIFYMIGATPEEVERRHGLGSATFFHTVKQILGAGFETVLFAIVADDSGAKRQIGEPMRLAQRTYTLYELDR